MVKNKFVDFADITDNLGQIYIAILFISGIIWAFIAINNFDTPNIFKLALIYSILLIFGFIGISYDRRTGKLGLDSRIWEGNNIKNKLIISLVLFAVWYLLFLSGGFSVATAQSVTGSALFTVSPALNWFLTSVLGPLAENIFFFGVINISFVTLLKKMLNSKDKAGPIFVGAATMGAIPLVTNVPNSAAILVMSGALIIGTAFTRIPFLMKHAPAVASALTVGGVVFPKFHSFAYQLNEANFIAAQIFGIAVSLLATYIGMLPVDLLHFGNNAAVISGLG